MKRQGLLLLLALVGCAQPGTPPEPVPLSAEVRQYRNDVAVRRLSVTVTNRGDAPVRISGARLVAPGFAPLPSAGPEVELLPGDRVDLPVAYGQVSCPPSPAGPDRAELLVDGRTVLVDLPADGGLLQRLRNRDCTEQAVAAAVTLELGPFTRRGAALQGTLALVRRGSRAPVRLTETGGTIVYTVRATGLPADLAPGQARRDVPVTVTASRCDGHALSQNSRSAVLTFFVAVGTAEPVQVPVTAGPALQSQLADLATDTCVPPDR